MIPSLLVRLRARRRSRRRARARRRGSPTPGRPLRARSRAPWRDLEGTPEELGCVRIRELRPRPFGGDQREAPCLLGQLGEREVQRKRLGHLVFVDCRFAQHVGHASVQLAAAPEGQALVRRVADQCVTEVEGPGGVRVALDELPEPIPRLDVECRVGVAFQHARDEVAREAGAEHGRPAQQRPVARRETVDPAREHAFDAFRQLLEPLLRPARGGDELLHEERVAARSLGDRRELLGWQPSAPAATASSCASASGNGSRRRDMAGTGGFPAAARKPLSPGRRVAHTSHGLVGDPAAEVAE